MSVQSSVLLLDIEGTTTPVDFVYKVLFPYAREHVREYVEQQQTAPELQSDLEALYGEHASDVSRGERPPEWPEISCMAAAAAYIHWLMDRDRKSTPLKSVQGQIWAAGYARGGLKGEIYPDVPPALERWQKDGKTVAIFSSGSVLAQKLLFAHSSAGDLTPFITKYFDTTTGPKRNTESYKTIATSLESSPAEILFVSDTCEELNAARGAGVNTALCVRPGSGQGPAHAEPHLLIHTFDEI